MSLVSHLCPLCSYCSHKHTDTAALQAPVTLSLREHQDAMPLGAALSQ